MDKKYEVILKYEDRNASNGIEVNTRYKKEVDEELFNTIYRLIV